MIQAWLRRSGTRFRELGVHQRQLWPPVSVQSHDHFKQPIKTLPGLPGLCVLAWWFCVPTWCFCVLTWCFVLAWWVPGWVCWAQDRGTIRLFLKQKPVSETDPDGTPSTNTGSICSEAPAHLLTDDWRGGACCTGPELATHTSPSPKPVSLPSSLLGTLGSSDSLTEHPSCAELENKRTHSICDIFPGDQIGPRTKKRTRTPKPRTHSLFPSKHRGRKR